MIRKLFNRPAFAPLFLSAVFVLIHLFLYQKTGIKTVNDSRRYLEYAENLSGGFYIERHNFLYFGYVLFLFFIKKFTAAKSALIAGQILFSGLGLAAIYRAGNRLFGKPTGFFAALLLMCFIKFLHWNFYLLAESLYGSFVCLSLYFLVRLSDISPTDRRLFLPAGLVFLFTFFCKPTGIVLPLALVAAFLPPVLKKLSRPVKIGLSVFVFLGFILLINRMLVTFTLVENFARGELVYGVTYMPPAPHSELLTIDAQQVFVPPPGPEPLVRLLWFAGRNPFFLLKLFSSKILIFWSNMRPYWSGLHNFFVLIYLYPVYFLAGKKLLFGKLPSRFRRFSLAWFLGHSLVVGLTTTDWDGRFFVPLFPLLFLLAGGQIAAWFPQKNKSAD